MRAPFFISNFLKEPNNETLFCFYVSAYNLVNGNVGRLASDINRFQPSLC